MHSLSEKGRYNSCASRIWILCVINAGKLRKRTSPLAQWWNRVISKRRAGMNISRVTARETWLSFANSETLWSNSCQNIWHECHRNRYRWSVRRFDFSTFFDLRSRPRVDCNPRVLYFRNCDILLRLTARILQTWEQYFVFLIIFITVCMYNGCYYYKRWLLMRRWYWCN